VRVSRRAERAANWVVNVVTWVWREESVGLDILYVWM